MKYKRKSKINFTVKNINYKKYKLVIVILFFVIVKIYLSLNASSSGTDLSSLEGKIENLQKENYRLRKELAQTSSLSLVNSRAEELGFSKPSAIVYLKTDEAVAKIP